MASTRYLDVESLGRLCRVHSRFAWTTDHVHVRTAYANSASRPTKFRRAFTLNRPARGCRLMRLKTGGIDIQVGITENGIIQHVDGIQPEFELFGLRNPDPLDTGR